MERMSKLLTIAAALAMILGSWSASASDNFMDWVGMEHNQGVKYVLQHLQELPEGDAIVEKIDELTGSFFIMTRGSYDGMRLPPIPETIEELDPYEWIKEAPVSYAVKQYEFSLLNLLSQDMAIEEFEQALELLERRAMLNLSGGDLEIFLSSASVARHSMRFWTPCELGGMGGLEYLHICGVDTGYDSRAINWWKVLGCDCLGGIFGGAGGYICASLISVVMQL